MESSSDDDDDGVYRDEWDENLMGDAADHEYLHGLSQLEREEVLFERVAQREKMRDRWEARRRMKEEKKEAKHKAAQSAKKKQKDKPARAPPPEPESRRVVAKDKKSSEKAAALADLQAKRQKARKTAKYKDLDNPNSESDDDSGSDKAEETRDRDTEETPSRPARRVEEEEGPGSGGLLQGNAKAELKHLESIRLPRQKLEEWIEEPFFAKIVPHCFVRIGIGNNQGIPVYRMAQVERVDDDYKKYEFRNKPTYKGLVLRIGDNSKTFAMSFVSNGQFTQQEYGKWKEAMSKATETDIPTIQEVRDKVEELKGVKKYAYSEQEVAELVDARRKNFQKLGNTAMLRRDLQQHLEKAEVEQDENAVKELTNSLQKLKDMEDQAKRESETKAYGVCQINAKNKRLEKITAEKVGLEKTEMEKRLLEDPSLAQKVYNDPFARRPYRPQIYWHVPTNSNSNLLQDKSLEQQQEQEQQPVAAEGSGLTVNTDLSAHDNSLVSSHSMSLLASTSPVDSPLADSPSPSKASLAKKHDFDLDINLDACIGSSEKKKDNMNPPIRRPSSATSSSSNAASSKVPNTAVKLSLNDYKRRMGLLE